MGIATKCDNPMCSCDPCTCDVCSCGVVRLGEFERRVMDVLWKEPDREITIREVADVFPDYAYTTVATMVYRLAEKGLVQRTTEGRPIRFVTIGDRGSHTAVLMHEALVIAGDPDSALVHFAETLSPSESAVLRRALNRLERLSRKTEG
jgi:predicted transcriptional regulator